MKIIATLLICIAIFSGCKKQDPNEHYVSGVLIAIHFPKTINNELRPHPDLTTIHYYDYNDGFSEKMLEFYLQRESFRKLMAEGKFLPGMRFDLDVGNDGFTHITIYQKHKQQVVYLLTDGLRKR